MAFSAPDARTNWTPASLEKCPPPSLRLDLSPPLVPAPRFVRPIANTQQPSPVALDNIYPPFDPRRLRSGSGGLPQTNRSDLESSAAPLVPSEFNPRQFPLYSLGAKRGKRGPVRAPAQAWKRPRGRGFLRPVKLATVAEPVNAAACRVLGATPPVKEKRRWPWQISPKAQSLRYPKA